MHNDYALPKFETPEARKKKWLKRGLIGGVGLVVLQAVIVVAVIVGRGADAPQPVAARSEGRAGQAPAQEAGSAASEAAAGLPQPSAAVAAAHADEGRRDGEALAGLDDDTLPPRAESDSSDGDEPAVEKRRSRRERRAARRVRRKRSARARVRATASATRSRGGDDRMKADEIDKLISQF